MIDRLSDTTEGIEVLAGQPDEVDAGDVIQGLGVSNSGVREVPARLQYRLFPRGSKLHGSDTGMSVDPRPRHYRLCPVWDFPPT